MRVGYVQNSPIFGEKQRNFDEVESLVRDHSPQEQIDLLVLPELFATGYAFVSRDEAHSLGESADGRTAEFLRGLAETIGGVVVAGFAEQDGNHLYNSSLIVDSGRILGTYRKTHLFNKETLFFDPGDVPPHVFAVGDYVLGVMICFDWIFPEAMRLLMLQGADVVAHPSNLVLPYCQGAMKTRCLENRLFAVTANRVGTDKRGEDNFTFTGASQITATDGSVLSSAPVAEAFMDVVTIDPAKSRDKNINPYNNIFSARRTDLYDGLIESREASAKGAE